MKKKIKILVLLIAALAGFLYLQNNWIGVSKWELTFDKLPENFDGFKVIHLSDLHSKFFGKNQQQLVTIIKKSEPDIIVITGDLVDRKHYDEQAALSLVHQAVKIAPVYFVMGNHEWWSGRFVNLEKQLVEAGVHVLRNNWQTIERDGQKIFVCGIDDPAAAGSQYDENGFIEEKLQETLTKISKDSFRLLLSHRPEKMPLYTQYEVDLVLSGHAHGGQFRIPFVGGIVAPDQGFFPQYTSGVYRDRDTTMVVSRGLGNSIIPQRIFNRPEVIDIVLNWGD
ncbi:metallophosphoesterase [Geosporobacter ferrireducens]|uniref:Phosphoesterase n=1 Tax=Geosporobacter ferrireducens TaxID=1424294 RepID=A0A1D8GKY1_9FIRM|nr:metallophosphoesterase [Geosporobacter ferrireducens]AOT71552.1 phosphoesterase [Geosporobacter ferrireducens]MTI57864.1 metallophosphoesterase [Geosporobacter ferrireducens]